MYIVVNNEKKELTPEEVKSYEDEAKRQAAIERHRPLTLAEVQTIALRQSIQTIKVDDATAVRMRSFYPEWAGLIGQTAEKDMKFQYNGDLYAVNQPHTFAEHWKPGEGTESMYRLIPEYFAGDDYDPIPYKGNLALEVGKVYTEGGIRYRGIRDSGIPVHDRLADLVGNYVEVV